MADGSGWKRQGLQPDARAIQAAHDQDHQDHDREQPPPEESVEGEGEDVIAHVLVPDRVRDPERFLIQVGQGRLPLPRGDPAEEQPEENDDQEGKDRSGRCQLTLPDANRREPPARVEGDQDVRRADDPEQNGKDEKGDHLRFEARPEHVAIPQRVEPEVIGIKGGKGFQEKQQQQDHGCQDDPEDGATGDADLWKVRLRRQPAQRRLPAVEEASRGDSPRHG